MSRRSNAREAVFQVLYQDDLNPKISPSVGDDLLVRRLQKKELLEFGRSLLAGVRRNRPELDARLDSAADNWSVARMAPTDRNALRIGAYEVLFTDTPDPVAVNEAIDLAKRFGTDQSSAFVNGILDRLMHARDAVASTEEDKPAAEADQSVAAKKPAGESLLERAKAVKEARIKKSE